MEAYFVIMEGLFAAFSACGTWAPAAIFVGGGRGKPKKPPPHGKKVAKRRPHGEKVPPPPHNQRNVAKRDPHMEKSSKKAPNIAPKFWGRFSTLAPLMGAHDVLLFSPYWELFLPCTWGPFANSFSICHLGDLFIFMGGLFWACPPPPTKNSMFPSLPHII